MIQARWRGWSSRCELAKAPLPSPPPSPPGGYTTDDENVEGSLGVALLALLSGSTARPQHDRYSTRVASVTYPIAGQFAPAVAVAAAAEAAAKVPTAVVAAAPEPAHMVAGCVISQAAPPPRTRSHGPV